MMDMKIGNYMLKKCIGKGSFADVFLATKIGTNQLVAVKRIEKANAEKLKKYLINELSILKQINHPNIIKLYDFVRTSNHYYIITEYCNGGSLGNCLNKFKAMYHKAFPEEYVQHLMRQIVGAIQYLHNNRIIHRDLKLDNILVNFFSDQDMNTLNMMRAEVKIIDFDFSRYLSKAEYARTVLGSPITMDPKILSAANLQMDQVDGYDDSVDIWSLGILCYEMLIGRSPFFSETVPGIIQKVESGSYAVPLYLSKEIVSFLNGMIQYNSTKRLDANQLARHHFLVKNTREFTPLNLSGKINNVRDGNLIVNTKDPFWKDYSVNDLSALNQVSPDLLVPQQNMNANYFWNNPNNIQNYFTPYNFALGGVAQVQQNVAMPIGQAVVNQYPVTQFNPAGLNNYRIAYGGI